MTAIVMFITGLVLGICSIICLCAGLDLDKRNKNSNYAYSAFILMMSACVAFLIIVSVTEHKYSVHLLVPDTIIKTNNVTIVIYYGDVLVSKDPAHYLIDNDHIVVASQTPYNLFNRDLEGKRRRVITITRNPLIGHVEVID